MTARHQQRAAELPRAPARDRDAAERARARLAAIVEAAEDAIVATDLEGIVTDWNRSAEIISGFSAAEMIGSPITRITPADRLQEEEAILQRIARGERIPHFESRRRTKDGKFVDVSVTVSPILDETGRVIGASRIARDITVQKQRDRELDRLARIHASLSQINQAIVFSDDQEALFRRVCDVLISHAGFATAGIGGIEKSDLRFVPWRATGRGAENIVELAECVGKENPCGRALRSGRPCILGDLRGEQETGPWADPLLRLGIVSMAVFPIRVSEAVRAILVVCSEETDFFRDREVALLVEAASDLSFALTRFEEREERREAERAAEEERRFSATMIESMPGILYFYDNHFRFLRWNRNFETVSGYTGEEIRRMEPSAFFAEEEKPLLQQRIAEVFENGESSLEAKFVSKDGSATPYYFTGRRVISNGAPCLVGVGVDISERKRAEDRIRESEARYRTLFDYAPVGILIADTDTRYLDANACMCAMLGYTRDELVGMPSSEIVAAEEQARIPEAVQSIRSTADYRKEWTFRRKDGSTFPAAVNATVMPDGSILAMIRDISEQVAAEEAMRRLTGRLEEQVVERTKDLQTALLQAEAADRIKSAFLATMSHELRTPLNSIIGFTGIILQGLAGPLNEEQARQLGMVRGSARHLLDLINDVLDLSKIEAGQLEIRPEPFDLRQAVVHVADVMRPLAEKKGISLGVSLPESLGEMVSDRRRVEQILLNLLNNAVKFTETGRVELAVEIVSDAGSPAVRLRVADTGVGMRAEDLASLFQPFRQLDTGITRTHEGTGLGLAICRRLATLLGGRIFAESVWQEGSVFTVILPLRSPTPP